MPNPDSNARIEALLAAMTLGEKIGQMTLVSAGAAVTGPGGPVDHLLAVRSGAVGAICNLWGAEQTQKLQRVAVEETRLGIPVLFTMDVIHGHRTIFPVPLAEVGAFDPGLWERTARTAAAEAAADGVAMTYAPMLDVARDPRWGRIVESPGEDPWVAARYAHAKIRGFQGQDLAATDSLAATAKHVAAYGAVIAGREYAPVDVSERSLHEIYLPPFEEAVEAGVAGIMPAFHNLAGMPMTANRAVLRDLARGRWGFEGVNVSDYAAIAELVVHGVAAAVMMLQIIETRIISVISWYYLAFFVISVAMFGLTAGAVSVYLRPKVFTPSYLSFHLAVSTLGFALATVASLLVQLTLATTLSPTFTGVVVWTEFALALAVPFFFSGIAISLALMRSPYPVGKGAGVDLLGAATGCLGVLLALNLTSGPAAVLWLAAALAGAALLFAVPCAAVAPAGRTTARRLFRRRRLVCAVLLLLAGTNELTGHGVPSALR